MIIILIAISLIYVILLVMVLKAYYRDNADLYDRILVLEKRLEDFKNVVKKDYKGIYIPIDEECSILLPLCEKENYDIKKIKNTFKKEGECMACRKGKGGRKK